MISSSFRAAALALALGITAGAHAQSVTTLNIDTRNTGVDLGLQHNADGTISPKMPAGTVPVTPGALGTNATDLAPPGTSTLGNPTSAGRQNGNSGTNDGRTTPGVSGGTGIFNSGTSGNGLPPSGNTGAGSAATGNTGNATAGSAVDAQTAAAAASSSRTVSGTIAGARILNGVPGQALQNGRGMGNLSNGSNPGTNSTGSGASSGGTSAAGTTGGGGR